MCEHACAAVDVYKSKTLPGVHVDPEAEIKASGPCPDSLFITKRCCKSVPAILASS